MGNVMMGAAMLGLATSMMALVTACYPVVASVGFVTRGLATMGLFSSQNKSDEPVSAFSQSAQSDISYGETDRYRTPLRNGSY